MPRAAAVPITVARRLESRAISRELPRRGKSLLSRNSSAYRTRVKPSKSVMSLPVLKEATMRTNMGRYRKRKIKTV